PDPLQVVRCPTHPRADLLADAAEAELYVALAESEPAAEGVEVEGGHADPGEAERHGVTDHGRGMVEQRGEAQPLRALDAFLPADEQLHRRADERRLAREVPERGRVQAGRGALPRDLEAHFALLDQEDRKSTRLNSSHVKISYAAFCLK